MSVRFIAVGLILATAIALGVIAWHLAGPPPQATAQTGQAPPPPRTEAFLVAAHPLPAGTLVRAADLATRQAAVGHVPQGAIPDTTFARASVEGALIRIYTDAGAPIIEANVLRPRDRGFLAAVLPPGMRAVSIPVDQVSGVAGLIWPGDHVDVLLTQTFDPTGKVSDTVPARQVQTRTVLDDARVIAVDQEIVQGAPSAAKGAGRVARTVTLQVGPRDAERIAVAQNLGRLSLAIRAVDRSLTPRPVGQAAVTADDVSPGEATGAGRSVQVIQGDQRTEVHFP